MNSTLKLIRQYHNFKSTDLARKLGVSVGHLSGIETQGKIITFDLLDRYAQYFDLPVSSIICLHESLNGGAIGPFATPKVQRIYDWAVEIQDFMKAEFRK